MSRPSTGTDLANSIILRLRIEPSYVGAGTLESTGSTGTDQGLPEILLPKKEIQYRL
jgi:hypothetical protein